MKIESDETIHGLDNKTSQDKMKLSTFIIILLVVAVVGGGIGYLGGSFGKNSSTGGTAKSILNTSKKSEGVLDKKRFPDSVEGLLKEGGSEGEGNFHLERPGGQSQNVYLTSSIIDLSRYIGQKVKVNGETQKAQKVGWLMDVGYIEKL